MNPLPYGYYRAEVTDLAEIENLNGSGRRLKISCRILSGAAQEQPLAAVFHLFHRDPKIRKRAEREFLDFQNAAGAPRENLPGKKLVILLGRRLRKDTGDIVNAPEKYLSIQDYEKLSCPQKRGDPDKPPRRHAASP